MPLEVEAWRRLASAFTPAKERRVIRKKINTPAMANIGRMVLHFLALLLLVVCMAFTFRSSVMAGSNAPLVQAETRVSSSLWWTVTSWVASSSLTKLEPMRSNLLQEGRDKDHETSLLWKKLASWLASLSSSSSSSIVLKTQDQDMDIMLPGSSTKEGEDEASLPSSSSSSPSWWWFPSSLASASLYSAALSSTETETMQPNASKETTLCPLSCFRPNPVCGVDGVTYWCGSVDAQCAGVEVDYKGFCEFDSKGTEGKGILAIQSLLLVHMVWLMLAAFLVFLGLL